MPDGCARRGSVAAGGRRSLRVVVVHLLGPRRHPGAQVLSKVIVLGDPQRERQQQQAAD